MGRINWEKDRKRRLVRDHGFEPRAATAGWNEPPPESDRKVPFAASLSVGNKRARGKAALKKAGYVVLPRAKLNELKLQLLHLVARAELRNLPIPGLPKKLQPDLEPAVRGAGGVLEWARRQPDYGKVRKQQAKKLDIGASVPEHRGASGTHLRASFERLAEAQRNLRQLLAQAESELQGVEQEIDRLRQAVELNGDGEGDKA